MARPVKFRSAERGLVGLLAVVLCWLWPLASWHELTTPHAVCPEHGERLDLAHDEERADRHDGPRLVAPNDGHAHEECAFTPLAQPAEGEPPAWFLGGEVLAEASPDPEPVAVRSEARPRYLLAPKQSPPSGRSN